MISPAVRRLHEIAWFPGRHMHASWWGFLGLQNWADLHGQSTYCGESIDSVIRSRRAFPSGRLPAELDGWQAMLMGLEPRLEALALALGLVAMGRLEYLMLSSYRRAFEGILTGQDCDHLLALAAVRVTPCADVAPHSAVALASQMGLHWLDRDLRDDTVWTALRVLAMAPDLQPAHAVDMPRYEAPAHSVKPGLMRIGRML